MIKFDFVNRRKWWFILSALVIIPGLISMAVQGFNLGIDFTGGTLIDLKFAKPVTVVEVRGVLKEYQLEHSTIQLASAEHVDAAQNVMIRTNVLTEAERRDVLASFKEKIGAFDVLRVEKVGAVVGGELTRQAILALAISAVLIAGYVTFRFESNYAIPTLASLLHDILIVLCVFSLLQIEVDASFVAALLTVLGYSINDTIVIFDRMRENMRSYRKGGGFAELVNRSIWQTMTRSIYTVLTVLFGAASLYFFGGDTTKNFSFALIVGFTTGAYSSIFIASPIWVMLRERADRKRQAARTAK